MNRREMRAVEYYGYALIAGIPRDEARRMTPGWIMDMATMRARYDAKVAAASGIRL